MTDKSSYTDPSSKYRAPRFVRIASDTPNTATENQPQLLEAFRNAHAWVLLGEPGAGKSTAFKTEAEATGGVYLRIAEFIELDSDEVWRAKTLFLDGLDEVRAGGDSSLLKIHNKLKKLGNPPFRLSCRAADWFGATDKTNIEAAAADKKITVLLLEPLRATDILCILRDNHSIANPENFVKEAQKRGIDGLLDNPQTLELLAKAVRGDQFPETRQETYQLACEKMAAEANKVHRDKKRGNAISVEARLEAAGQLCAVLLFADQTGIALDIERVKESFIEIETCKPPYPDAANAATQSKLFRPAASEERVEPTHRTIAEFLAARWLGQQVKNGLPLKRVLNLLLGRDGRTVAGLRGLYAWLALECTTARTQLIQADPFTVLIYGDVRPMSVADKRMILQGLKQEAERFPAFRWQAQSAYPFGALVAEDLILDFTEALTSPDRSEAVQSFADFVLEVLAAGVALPKLAPTVKAVVLDDSRNKFIRWRALNVWLKLAEQEEQLGLLDEVIALQPTEANVRIVDELLPLLYPAFIQEGNLSNYLFYQLDKNTEQIYCTMFWHDLPEIILDSDLSSVLERLSILLSHEQKGWVEECFLDGLLDYGIVKKLLELVLAAHGSIPEFYEQLSLRCREPDSEEIREPSAPRDIQKTPSMTLEDFLSGVEKSGGLFYEEYKAKFPTEDVCQKIPCLLRPSAYRRRRLAASKTSLTNFAF